MESQIGQTEGFLLQQPNTFGRLIVLVPLRNKKTQTKETYNKTNAEHILASI